MEMLSLEKELKENSYPGRGIVIGKTPNGKVRSYCIFHYGKKRKQQKQSFCRQMEKVSELQAFDPSKLVRPKSYYLRSCSCSWKQDYCY